MPGCPASPCARTPSGSRPSTPAGTRSSTSTPHAALAALDREPPPLGALRPLYGDGHAAERCVVAIGSLCSEQPDARIGVVGLGYWGPNLARNFAAIPGCELTWLCDASSRGPRAARARRSPRARHGGGPGGPAGRSRARRGRAGHARPDPRELAMRVRGGGQALLRREAARDHRRRRRSGRRGGRAGRARC